MIIVFSGIRDLIPESYANVELAVLDSAIIANELRFGGAIGSDTIALDTACDIDVRSVLHVFVPWTIKDQPKRTQEVIARADVISELKLPRHNGAYLTRNDVMLKGANQLIAFTDGREDGGTAYTIKRAQAVNVPTEIILVKGTRTLNPLLHVPFAYPKAYYHGMFPYKSERQVHAESNALRASRAVRHLKVGVIADNELSWLADQTAKYIIDHGLTQFSIVPMPRRVQNVQSDLLPLAIEVSKRTGQTVLNNWLMRVDKPVGGIVKALRTRYSHEEHARTFRAVGPQANVLILDNVITSGGTAVGAQQAVLRDTGVLCPVLSILWADDLGVSGVGYEF